MYKPIMSLSCHVSVRTTTHICLGTDELGLFPDYLRKPPFAQAPEFFVDYLRKPPWHVGVAPPPEGGLGLEAPWRVQHRGRSHKKQKMPEDARIVFEKPQYFFEIASYMDDHVRSHECAAQASAAVVKDQLLQELVPRVEEFAFHNSLKDAIRDQYLTDLSKVVGNTLYLLYDFKGTCIL